ncbi:MAG: ABC transporter permease subunit [Eubacteriales bacterium]|nr:ABC transporter permease subunit [Eubacteriales bacterium]
MTILFHELRRGRAAFVVWTGVIAFMIIICMALFPEMKEQMAGVNALFANMGSFTAAFGMDQVSFGEVMGFYAIECGNILGLGGAFYAALLGISALAKEEKEHTAEFLLAHPIARFSVIMQKLSAVFVQLLVMNLLIAAVAAVSFQMIGESMKTEEFLLLHGAFLVMQIEIAGICFGISAYIRSSGLGIGLGLAAVMYFLNIIANISDQADILRYVTPFAYAEASDIVAECNIDGRLMGLGILYMAAALTAGVVYYRKKDIAV